MNMLNHSVNHELDCLSHMHANGISFDGPLICDGKLHRFSMDAKKNQPDEWYRCYQGISSKVNAYLNCYMVPGLEDKKPLLIIVTFPEGFVFSRGP